MILFSSSHIIYVKEILKVIDPTKTIFKFILHKKQSFQFDKVYIKSIDILNRNPKDIIIVDDTSLSFSLNLDNGIPIIPFFGNKEDIELLMLKSYLKYLKLFNDVRTGNRKFFKLYKYQKASDLKSLFKYLFKK